MGVLTLRIFSYNIQMPQKILSLIYHLRTKPSDPYNCINNMDMQLLGHSDLQQDAGDYSTSLNPRNHA